MPYNVVNEIDPLRRQRFELSACSLSDPLWAVCAPLASLAPPLAALAHSIKFAPAWYKSLTRLFHYAGAAFTRFCANQNCESRKSPLAPTNQTTGSRKSPFAPTNQTTGSRKSTLVPTNQTTGSRKNPLILATCDTRQSTSIEHSHHTTPL